MSKREDRIRFLSDPIRLRIADLCRDQWRTQGELAAELEREAGSLSQPRTMVGRGVLEQRPRSKTPGGRRAKTYRLKKSWRPALEAAKERQTPAWPEAGQDLLVIPLADTANACAAIAAGIPDIEWAATVRGGVAGMILAPAPRPNGVGRIRALKALGEVAPRVTALQLDAPMSGPALREWSSQIVAKELPSGN